MKNIAIMLSLLVIGSIAYADGRYSGGGTDGLSCRVKPKNKECNESESHHTGVKFKDPDFGMRTVEACCVPSMDSGENPGPAPVPREE